MDLTHTLSPTFPTPWKDPLALEPISKLGKEKWNIFRWHLNEHIGTHLDAPLHCTDLDSADRIPVERLVGPLVIVDIRERAASNPDSQLTLDDLIQFLHEERKVNGIATDTLNLDAAVAGDFPVHHYWLGQNKWGLENVANLGLLPPHGATIVVGSPKIAGCTGGPSRVLALF
jgi:kynurenine formamidase